MGYNARDIEIAKAEALVPTAYSLYTCKTRPLILQVGPIIPGRVSVLVRSQVTVLVRPVRAGQ